MTDEEGEKLVGMCDGFCNLEGDKSRMGVFSDVKDKKAVYYCGLGKEDCIVANFHYKLNKIGQMAAAARRDASYVPLDCLRF